MSVFRRATLALLVSLVGAGALPGVASAHGPSNPVATDYVAKIASVPGGLQAKVVDGDLRLWLRVPAGHTVMVLDYRGAPYLRFAPAGVWVNENSEMYYLNQTPVAQTPPRGLSATTPPSWQRVTREQAYLWHDGRLHALATVALPPGTAFVGRWTVPLVLDGHQRMLSGGVWHRGAPSIVWFWPIVVLLACVLAGLRVRSARLDTRVGRLLAIVVLLAIAVASAGRAFHGRPAVAAFGLVELGVVLALVAFGLYRVVWRDAGFLALFVIAFIGLWEGITLVSTLRDGYVLMAVPAFVARCATVVCLGGSGALVLVSFRLASGGRGEDEDVSDEDQRLHESVA
jgi:hypothetical protein